MAATPNMMAEMEDLSDGEQEDNKEQEQDSDANNSDDVYDGEDLSLPPLRYEKLEVNGQVYDLRDAREAHEAQKVMDDYRMRVRKGEVFEYEGKSTKMWSGGRSRILYDEIRADMAVDYHEGNYDVSWEQQDQEARRIIEIRAATLKAQGK